MSEDTACHRTASLVPLKGFKSWFQSFGGGEWCSRLYQVESPHQKPRMCSLIPSLWTGTGDKRPSSWTMIRALAWAQCWVNLPHSQSFCAEKEHGDTWAPFTFGMRQLASRIPLGSPRAIRCTHFLLIFQAGSSSEAGHYIPSSRKSSLLG